MTGGARISAVVAAALQAGGWNTGGFVSWGSYLLWAFIATLVLAGGMFTAQERGLSRMSIPFILGSAWTTDRQKAKLIGFGAHFLNGMLFAFVYVMGFEALGRATWWLGALGGVVHTFIVLTVGLPLVAAVHPNMASERQGPTPTRWLQPPGFLGLNYGRRTPLAALLGHIVYGAILGGFYHVA